VTSPFTAFSELTTAPNAQSQYRADYARNDNNGEDDEQKASTKRLPAFAMGGSDPVSSSRASRIAEVLGLG
jgi:hypothetical protein